MIDASEVLKELTQNSKDFEYEKYIKKITFQKDLSKNNHFIFSIPNIFILKWIKHKYSTLSEKNLLNKDNIKIDFILSKNIKNKQKIPIQKKEEDIKSVEKKISVLNPSFNFENFVVGASNQFAYVTSLSSAKNPGKEFNPLVIYGDVGLGKTHILHAIGNYCSSLNVICITAEAFMNDFSNSLINKKMNDFKNKYRNCDLLLIDDIQFIKGKFGIQEEFFHTFNELHSKSIQIVLTSDEKPSNIRGLENRLKSRFEMGITANIKQPELETKINIIKKKCQLDNIKISDEITIYIATNLNSSIREIEGVLMKLNAYANMINQNITLEFTKNILKEHISQANNKISIDNILKIVSINLNVKPSEIKSKSKIKKVAEARRITMFLIREFTKKSTIEIANFFLMKEHSSVSHATKKIKKDIKNIPDYHKKIEDLKSIILLEFK
jgi:chromosomal replication initiator protein